ncbi:uncharacterized protein TRIREDRAFT_105556 [Trichoderma reesei QM6a]|uniref:Predicted protein n=2 Tax=Hypocrea jecorina TaxID=51453 RepID=G0RF48_HYPJQ|nr:uncharacterized protein TRIREDRAFT_105556 [Trichoderma reesei QM6a]EGR50429.1 predicted protein [Trichoderma reesei QM6a]ETS03918.1 hypothetical protein M419DRAFT_128319 [Trichoderma reesei RUT C-30]
MAGCSDMPYVWLSAERCLVRGCVNLLTLVEDFYGEGCLILGNLRLPLAKSLMKNPARLLPRQQIAAAQPPPIYAPIKDRQPDNAIRDPSPLSLKRSIGPDAPPSRLTCVLVCTYLCPFGARVPSPRIRLDHSTGETTSISMATCNVLFANGVALPLGAPWLICAAARLLQASESLSLLNGFFGSGRETG